MKLSLKTMETISFFLACLLGVLFHFVYEWSGNHPLAALFFPVNESTWEHLKLIFYPIFILSIPEYFALNRHYPGFFCIKFLSSLLGMLSTIIMYYTYLGVYGKNVDFINIALYFIAMAAAYIYSYRALYRQKTRSIPAGICIAGNLLVIFLFILFTKIPPAIGLFQSPA